MSSTISSGLPPSIPPLIQKEFQEIASKVDRLEKNLSDQKNTNGTKYQHKLGCLFWIAVSLMFIDVNCSRPITRARLEDTMATVKKLEDEVKILKKQLEQKELKK